MSRLAQAVSNQIAEMSAHRRTRGGKRMSDEHNDVAADTSADGQPQQADATSVLPPEQEQQTMAKKSKTTRKVAEKPRQSKPRSGSKKTTTNERYSQVELPDLDELRLAQNGIRAEERNRYVTIEFVDGPTIRLSPANVRASDALKVRNFVVEWMRLRIAR